MGARRIGTVFGDAVLAVLAAAGACCIALVVAALAFDVSIMLFSTGSMSPAIPAGSAALVREIPVDEVRLGDVVTVDRRGKLPVTHRVVGIDDSPGGERLALTLRGDANPVDDPLPYDVATVRIVLWSVPGAATVVTWFGNPVVLGALTIAMSVLVLWAFWPRTPRHGPPASAMEPDPPPRTPRHAASSIGAGAVAALAAASIALAAAPSPAQAAPVEQVVEGRYLRLTTIADPLRMTRLSPGDSASLLLGVSTIAEAPGTVALSLGVETSGGASLHLRVVECAGPPSGGACTDGREVLASRQLDASIADLAVAEVPAHAGRWFRFEVSLPEAAPAAAQGQEAELVVQANGFGELVATPGGVGEAGVDGNLAASGAEAAARLALAAGVLAVGLALAGISRARRRTTRPRSRA